MDNQRLLLFVALSFVALLLWEAWEEDYGPKATTQVAAEAAPGVPEAPADRPEMSSDAPASTPEEVVPATAGASDAPAVTTAEPLPKGERIVVTTDQVRVVIDTHGGDIRELDLLTYPVSTEEPDKPFVLMKDRLPNLFVAQSGLLAAGGEGNAPDHYATYRAEKLEYSLAPGASELRVPLVWENEAGIKVVKTFIFRPGSHVIDIEHQVINATDQPWTGRQYRQLQRTRPDGSGQSAFIYTYTGGVVYSEEEKYEKIEFDDMAEQDLAREITGGWAAMIQHYFLGAIIPDQSERNLFYTKAPGDDRFVLGLVSPARTVAAGQSDTFTTRYYIGPKVQSVLEELAPGLELTVDYGVLTVIAKPLFWALELVHGVVGNWGWAILIITLMIKLIFYPLSAASYRSMANMRRLAPKIQQLKERYGDDRQRMSQAMMEIYKKEKINPLGGCLPMLVQIPVFIALYWVLLESVELRQAPFILWIQDLSVRDPYYILPLLMGISMFIQQKLNPPPPDPVQAKILMALPIVFTLFFAFFPAGLVLYWVANSVLSIAQQWYITRKIEAAGGSK